MRESSESSEGGRDCDSEAVELDTGEQGKGAIVPVGASKAYLLWFDLADLMMSCFAGSGTADPKGQGRQYSRFPDAFSTD